MQIHLWYNGDETPRLTETDIASVEDARRRIQSLFNERFAWWRGFFIPTGAESYNRAEICDDTDVWLEDVFPGGS